MSFLLSDKLDEALTHLKSESRYRELSPSQGLSFVHNDYLGFSQHPEIIEAGKRALDIYGSGSRGSRLLGGHGRVFEEAESEIADFFGAPAATFFSSGYLANLAVLQALGPFVDEIVSDEKIHASLIDGIRLTGKPKQIIAHQNWDSWNGNFKHSLIVAESVYSMDGDIAPLEKLAGLAKQRDSWLLVDEAHAAGVFQETGQGLGASLWDWDRNVVTVTFGKAFGVSGAAVLGSPLLKQWLVNAARSFIYTTASSPVVPAMVVAALDVARGAKNLRQELWSRSERVREIFSKLGEWPSGPVLPTQGVWEKKVPIIPLLMPGSDKALRFAESVRQSGIEVRAIRYPTVPIGKERLRISLSLSVSRDNTENMAEEISRLCKAFL